MEIPRGNSRDDNKTRKQIIKGFYAEWNAAHPDKRVWNRALGDYIHIKYASLNETSGRASMSFESTREVFRLTEILANAKLVKTMPPKRDDDNQKPYSVILIMRHRSAMLVVGKQRTTGEYVQYCISTWDKKQKSRLGSDFPGLASS